MKLNAIIVEDEKISRDILSNYLQKYCPNVNLVGQAENIKEADMAYLVNTNLLINNVHYYIARLRYFIKKNNQIEIKKNNVKAKINLSDDDYQKFSLEKRNAPFYYHK